MAKTTHNWSITEAKARLSEIIRRAQRQGPQTISRRGRAVAVILAVNDPKHRRRLKGTLVDFLNASPLRGSGIRIERINDRPRDVDPG